MKKSVMMIMAVVMMFAAACTAENLAPRDVLTIGYCYSQEELMQIYESIDYTVYEGEEGRVLTVYEADSDGAYSEFRRAYDRMMNKLILTDADDDCILKDITLWICIEEHEVTGIVLEQQFYCVPFGIDVTSVICAYYDWHI